MSTVIWECDDKYPEVIIAEVRIEAGGRGIIDTSVLTVLEISGSATGTAEIPFTVPDDAQCSYDGKLMRVCYTVEERLPITGPTPSSVGSFLNSAVLDHDAL